VTGREPFTAAPPDPSVTGTIARRPLREDLRIAAWLALACALATAALFPYLLDLMPDLRAKITVPLALVVPAQALQGGVLLGLLAFVGLRLGPRTGLDAPWLRAVATGRPRPRVPWSGCLLAGALAGAVVVGLMQIIDPHLPPTRVVLPEASAWKGLLASFYGGIGEEVLLRLFLMTLLVWIVARVRRQPPGAAVYWTAIVAAALLFGAGHLPAAAGIWPLTTVVVLRTVALNALVGVAFGWLYWRRGLEAAMCAHFGADLVLHVAAPLLR
jgi:membrane protease YdiL (CAAX protease family)